MATIEPAERPDASSAPTGGKQHGGIREMDLAAGVTYRSLGQQRLSPAEERFERARRTIGLFGAPALLALLLIAPLDIPPEQQRLAAVLAMVIALWISEAIPIPIAGLLGIALVVLLRVAPADDVFTAFGDSTLFLFIGAFIIARAMLLHGLARRFAYRMLALPGAGRSSTRTIVTFGLITALLSAFISNTAAVAMLLPTAIGVLGALSGAVRDKTGAGNDFDPTRLRLGTALMLMLAYGAGVGGLLTPIGSPPNIIGRSLIEEATSVEITFFEWMLIAVPLCVVMFVLLAVILLLLNRPEVRRLEGLEELVARERERLGPLSRAEKNTLVAFGVAVLLWILPGTVGLIAGDDSPAYETVGNLLDEGTVAIVAASVLFLLPTDWSRRQFTLDWSDAATIDWGTILLFGSGIVFGALMGDTGLAETIGTSMADGLGLATPITLTAFAIVLAILISETTSNTASATIVVPIVLPVAQTAGVDPLVPGLAAVFAASFGFMLPVSTPQNAIVYGSGVVPITKMVRSGAVFDLLGAALLLVGIPWMVALVGLS